MPAEQVFWDYRVSFIDLNGLPFFGHLNGAPGCGVFSN